MRPLNNQHLGYRLGVGMMILNSANQIFMGKKSDGSSESWQMPQGGINPGEYPSQAVMREMLEELGTNNGIIIAETIKWYSYDLPAHIANRSWSGKYRGQKQKWFLIRFEGSDEEINLYSTAHPEFSGWQWMEVLQLPFSTTQFKLDLYNSVVEEFKDYLFE